MTPLFERRRESLYSRAELTEGFDGSDPATTRDQRIQAYYDAWRVDKPKDLEQGLAQREHDYYIDVALDRFIVPPGQPSRKLVGIMGSHSMLRSDPAYREVARLAWMLSPPQSDYLVVTGGGPGAMEAGSLGAFLAPQPVGAIDDALAALAELIGGPYIRVADELRTRYAPGGDSLAVPTWSYTGEPISQFSSHIAKYFENSVREDGLLAIALHGIVFAPGGAGTLQEIFQDAAQNTYWSYDVRSPMVFLGTRFFTEEFPAYGLMMARAEADGYADMVAICDTAEEAVEQIIAIGPRWKPPGAI